MKSIAVMPKIEIALGERTISQTDLRCLSRISVLQKLSHPTVCEVVFKPTDHGFSDLYPCRKQSVLSVFVKGEIFPLFRGIITAVETRYNPDGSMTLLVRGYDALYFSGKKQRIHTHLETTIPEMAKEMTKDSGIGIKALEAGPVWRQLVQYRETDLDFLARMAQRSGLYFMVNRENNLEIMNLSGNDDLVFLTRGDDLFELSVETNDAPVLSSVYASGWDPFLAEFHDGHSSSDSSDGQERKLMDIALRSRLEAETISKAELDRCRACETSIKGVADGNSRLMPGVTVIIGGIHPLLKKDFVLTEVAHTLATDTGYVSEFTSVPPDFRNSDTGSSATFGMVIDIDDPEHLGRIKASLPSFENAETDWMNVVLPAAGKNKGAIMLPDVGDQVLILFLNNDPARGVVAGSVFGSAQQPPDWGIEDNKVKRYCFVTPEGQKLTLDDDKQGVKIENRGGSYLEIYPETVTLHSATDLVIQAPEKKITILGQTIDFKKG